MYAKTRYQFTPFFGRHTENYVNTENEIVQSIIVEDGHSDQPQPIIDVVLACLRKLVED